MSKSKNITKYKRYKVDYLALACVFALMGIGTIMVYSSSFYTMLDKNLNAYTSYFKANIFYSVIGIGILVVFMNISYKRWNNKFLAYASYIVTMAMLIYVRFATTGVKGATRWLSIFGISVMPSEIAKITIALCIAYFYAKTKHVTKSYFYFRSMYMILFLSAFVFVFTNDLSTALVIAASGIASLFVMGVKFRYIFSTVFLGVSGIAAKLMMDGGMRGKRLQAYSDIVFDRSYEFNHAAYQSMYSIYSTAEGGLQGVGLGAGMIKVRLPEPYNDFILSTIAEELGLFGVLLIVLLFMILIFRLFRIANHCNDKFAFGFTLMMAFSISFQTLLNIYVVYNLTPVTGITLPFISRGGSSLVTLLFAIAIIMNISKNTEFE